MLCQCPEYQINSKQISDQAVYCHNRPMAPTYTGEPFRFCPWCGARLVEEDSIKPEVDEGP